MVTDFSAPHFLVTDFFVAREHASDIHLGTCGSQNHNGTDHCVKLAVEADASCQVQIHATPLTTTILGYHPYLHRQHHYTVTCNLEFAICVACLNLFLIGAKEMA